MTKLKKNISVLIFSASLLFITHFANAVSFTVSMTNVSCNGGNTGSILVTTGATETGPFTYVLFNGSPLSGGTIITSVVSSSYTYTFSGLKANLNYYLGVQDGGGSNSSMPSPVSEPATLVAGSIAASQGICNGSTPSALTGPAATGETGNYLYEWYGNGTLVASGGALTSYSPPALAATTVYTRKVTDQTCGTNATTSPVTITVYQTLISGSINAPAVSPICYNTAPSITGNVDAAGGSGFTYQWEYDPTYTGAGYVTIAGATQKDLTNAPNLTTKSFFRRKAIDATCGTVATAAVTVDVYNILDGGTISTTSPEICKSTSPGALTGTPASEGKGPLTYTWQNSTTSAAGPWTDIALSNNPNYTPGTLLATTYYRRKIHDGGCGTDAYSNVLTIAVSNMPAPTIVLAQGLTCSDGSDASFTGTISGGISPYTYTWLRASNNNPAGPFDQTILTETIAGTSSTVSSVGQGYYKLVITDKLNCSYEPVSKPFPYVYPLQGIPLLFTVGAAATNTCFGLSTGKITITASGGVSPYQYAITATMSAPSSFQSGNTFSLLAAGTYYAWSEDSNGCLKEVSVVVGTNAALVVNAGNDATICSGSNTSLGGTPTASGGSGSGYVYSWTPTTGLSSATVSNPTASPTISTTYTVSVTDGNNCSLTDAIVVTVNPQPTVANAGPDQTGAAMCGLTSTTLAGNTPTVGTGAWSIIAGAGGSITTPTSPTSTFSGTAGTTYTLRWTISNAPCTASTDDVVITFQQSPTVANAGPDQTGAAMCGLTSTTLAGNTPTVGTGAWSIITGAGGSITTPTSPTSTFSGTAGTTYTLRWTISNAPCTASTDDVVITFQQSPTVSNAGPDQTGAAMCGLTSTTLAGNTPTVGTGAWSIITGAGGSITTPTSPTSTFSGTAGTTYTLRWTISNAPCTASTDDVVITFQQSPTVSNAGPDQTGAAMCGLTSTTLAGNTPTVGTGAWSIIAGAGGSITTPTSPTSTFTGTAGTTYTLRWTITNGVCTSTDDVVITFQQSPTVANAGPDQTGAAMCGLTSTTLAGNTPMVGTGAWSIITGAGGSITTPTSPTSTFSGTAGTTYTLRWTISNAPCTASTDDVIITFQQSPTVSNAGPDQTGAAMCGLTSTTLAGNTPTVGTGAWSIIAGAGGNITTPTSPTSTFTGTAGTTYTLRWTISNAPCTASTDDVIITFQQSPTVSNAGPDQTGAAMCGLTSTTLAGNTPTVGTGAWSIIAGAGGSITTPTSPTSTFSGTAGTTYTLRWTISNAPCTASTDDVVITFQQSPTVSNAGPDQTGAAMCGLTSTTLAGNTPTVGTGAWSIITGAGGSITTPTSPTSTFSGTAGTTYTLRWTISNAPCTASTDDVVITFQQSPTVANAGPDQTGAAMCGLTSTTLAGNTPMVGTGAWSIITGAGGSITTPTSPTSTFSGTAGTTYTLRWTISNAPCTASTDDVVITFQQSPTVANAGPDQTGAAMCGLTSTTLAGNTPTVGTGAWSIIAGAGGNITTPTSPTSTFTGTAGTTYTLRWTISNAPCTASTDDVVITFQQSPTVANAGPDQTGAAMCGLTSTTLAGNTPTVGTGAWSIITGAGGSITTPTSPTSTFSGTAGTTYTLRWTISNAPCTASTDDVIITFQQSPTVANAGPDQTGAAMCGLTSTTLAGNTPTVGTGAWSIIAGAGGSITTPTSPTSTFTGTAGTTYTLRWTISNAPCTASTDDVVITFQQSPTVSNAGPDQTGAAMCGLTSTTLAGNTPMVGTGAWSIITGAGGSITTPTSPTSTFSGTAGTTYTLRWTISNAPCTASTDDVIITFQQSPTVSNAGPDQTGAAMCGLTSTTLAGNTPTVGTGAWSIITGAGGSITTPTSPTSTFSGTAGTTYTLRWTISNAPCTASTDDVVITFQQSPTVANAGPDQTGAAMCGLTSTTLAGNTPTVGTGAWSIIAGAGGSITSSTSPTSTFTGTAGTTYTLRWTISNAPCTASTDDVVITFQQSPTVSNAGPDQTGAAMCGLTSTTLAGNTPTVGTGAWSIITGAGGSITSPTSPTSTFSGTAGTTYTLRWTISNAPCTASTDDVVITFQQSPTVSNAGPDQTGAAMCGLTSTTLAGNTPTVGTGAWSIIAGAGGNITSPTSPTSTFTGTAGTTYTLRWTITNGVCTSTDDVIITFQQSPTVANAGPDQTGAAMCGLTSTTLAGNTPTVGTGAWSIITGAGGSITSPTSPTSTFSGTAGTTYTLRWTISNAPCTASTDDVVITFQQSPTVSNAGPDQTGAAMCGLTSTTLAGNTPTVGTGAWSIIAGAGGNITTPTSPTSTFTGTAGTTYTLRWTISNAPCTASTDDVIITFQQSATVSNAGPDQTGAAMCGLTSTTLAGNTPTVGTGAWSIIAGAGGSITTPTSPTSTFSGTAGTSYTLRWTISNAPCTASTDDVEITFQQSVSISLGANPSVCPGVTTASLNYNSPLGNPDQYSIDFNPTAESQGFSDIVNNLLPSSPISIIVPALAVSGAYNATITVINSVTGCSNNYPITITIYPVVTANITQNPLNACTGSDVNLDGNPSGGSGTYTTHLWTGSGAAYLNNTNIQAPIFNSSIANSYDLTYTVTDNNNCSASSTTNIDVVQDPTVNAGADVTICHNDNVTITDAVATSYSSIQWTTSGDGTFKDGFDNILNPVYIPGSNDKLAGSVTLTLTANSASCGSVSDDKVITIPPELITTIGSPTPYLIGAGTKIDVGVKITGRTTVEAIGYYLIAPDGTSLQLKSSEFCYSLGNSVDIDFSKSKTLADALTICGTSYQDHDISGTFGITGDWNILNGKDPANGAWRVQVTDCDNTFSGGQIERVYITFKDVNAKGDSVVLNYDSGIINTTIDQSVQAFTCMPTTYIVPIGLRTKCADCGSSNVDGATGVITKAGGTAPYSTAQWYNQTDPSTVIAIADTVNLCKGDYFAIVTDALGCIDTAFVKVTSPQPINIDKVTFSKNDTLKCFGDTTSLQVNLSGGTGLKKYTLNGITKNEGQTVTGLVAGVYPLHIFDANGCTKDTTITIVQPTKFYADSLLIRNVTCNGANDGKISLKGHDGTPPYHFVLEKGGVVTAMPQITNDSAVFTGLSPAIDYLLWVTDNNGCNPDTFKNIAITEPAVLTINTIDTSNYICFGQTDGFIRFHSVTGGTRPYQYSVDGGTSWQADSSFMNLNPGAFNLMVRDPNNCSAVFPVVTLKGASQIILNSSTITDVTTCYNDPAGAIKINATGGDGTLYFALNSMPYQIDSTFNGLLGGTYAVHVKDTLTKCIVNSTATINAPAAILIDSIVPTNVHGGVPGSFIVYAKGGAAPLEYSMDGITYQPGNVFSGLSVNKYYVYVQDSRGCKAALDSVYISSLTVTVTKTDVKCKGDNSGSITLSVAESGTFQYSIDGGATFQSTGVFDNLYAGIYTAYVKDATDASFTQVVSITEPDTALKIFAVLPTSPTCFNGNNGGINISAQGKAPLQFSIDGGTTYTSNFEFTNLNPGTYMVIVQDVNGCQKTKTTTVVNPSPITVTLNITNVAGLAKGSIKVVSVANGTGPYKFSIDGGANWTASTTFSNLDAGSYTLTTLDNTTNCSHDTIVFVNNGVSLNVAHAVTDIKCHGDSTGIISLAVYGTYENPVKFMIDGPVTITTMSDDAMTFPNLPGGDYLTTVIDHAGAEYQEIITVAQPDSLIVSGSVVNSSCNKWVNDGSISLNVTGGTSPYSYIWDGGNLTSSLTDLGKGQYGVTVTDVASCPSVSKVFTVNGNDSVKVSASADPKSSTCPGVSIVLKATGGNAWNWLPTNGLSSWIDQNPVFYADSSRLYKLTAFNMATGCRDTTSIYVTVFPQYNLRVGIQTATGFELKYRIYLDENKPIQLEALPDSFATYQWVPNTYLDNAASRTPIASVTIPTLNDSIYHVIATTSEGCIQTGTIVIHVRAHGKIPNGFIPGSDILEDNVWYLEGAGAYPNIHVEVFNRWGQRVFESTGYDNSSKVFDGTRNGHYLPAGTYYYIVDFKDGTTPETGSVTIVSTPK